MKRLIGITSAIAKCMPLGLIAISTLNLAVTLPVFASNSEFERPNPRNVRINKKPIKNEVPTTKIDRSQIEVLKKEPIKFRAFEMKDPKTGKAISPDKILELPNGKKVTAKEYYAELNQLEREFNQIGYSLREPGEKTTIQRSKIDKEQLQEQQESLKATPKEIDPEIQKKLEPSEVLKTIKENPREIKQIDSEKTISDGPDEIQRRLKSAKINSKLIPNLGQTKLAQVSSNTGTYTRNWNKEVGNRNTFAAYLRGELKLEGTNTYTRASAEGKAGSYVFNNNVELARATANLYAPVSGNGNVNANLYLVGQNVYNFQRQFSTNFYRGDSFSRSLDIEAANVQFWVGPIRMSAKLGVEGKASFRYTLAASGGSRYAYAQLNPFVYTRAYGQADVDIIVGGGGLGVRLLLLKDNLDARAFARVGFASGNRAYLQTYYSIYNDMEALRGNVYAYAYTYVPRFGIPPWRRRDWNWNIFNWKGFRQRGYLLRGNNRIYF
ncbi:MAG: hypothetical protein AAFW70_01555 [Cyanobacteria bacterium J06635_10]